MLILRVYINKPFYKKFNGKMKKWLTFFFTVFSIFHKKFHEMDDIYILMDADIDLWIIFINIL